MAELSITQIVIVLVIALLVFGPKRLPELGRQIGKGLRELRMHASSVGHELTQAIDDEAPAASARRAGPAAGDATGTPGETAHEDEDDLLDGVLVRSDAPEAPAGPVAASVDGDDDLLDGVVVSGAMAPDRRSG